MANISFSDFVEDVLDQAIGLMSQAEVAQARARYAEYIAPKVKAAKTEHPDMKMKMTDLRARSERLLASQKIAVQRAKGCALVAGDAGEHGLLCAFEWTRRSDQAGAAVGTGHVVQPTERLFFEVFAKCA
jgi:hypothetical protein